MLLDVTAGFYLSCSSKAIFCSLVNSLMISFVISYLTGDFVLTVFLLRTGEVPIGPTVCGVYKTAVKGDLGLV